LCSGGDFDTYLQKQPGGKITEKETRKWLRQLAQGLQFMRSKNLIHRDLKPGNLLLSCSDTNQATLKITDFTFARIIEVGDLATTLVGTPLYMAPDIFVDKKYTEKVDLWSVGVILFHCLTGRLPFNGKSIYDLFMQANVGKIMWKDEEMKNVSPNMKELVEELLQRDVRKRISWDQFFNHPFVSLDKKNVKKMKRVMCENEELKKKLEEKEKEKINEMGKMMDQIERTKKEAEEKEKELKMQMEMLEKEKNEIENQYQLQMKKLCQENEIRNLELNEENKKILEKQLIELNEQKNRECDRLQQKINELMVEKMTLCEKYEMKIKNMECEIESLKADLQREKEASQLKDKSLVQLKENVNVLEVKLKMEMNEKEDLKKENEKLKKEMNEKEDLKKENEWLKKGMNEKEDLKKECEKLKKEMQNLKSMSSEKEKKLERAKAVFRMRSKSEISKGGSTNSELESSSSSSSSSDDCSSLNSTSGIIMLASK